MQSISNSEGSFSESYSRSWSPNDSSKDIGEGSNSTPTEEGRLPAAPESSDSHRIDDQLLSETRISLVTSENDSPFPTLNHLEETTHHSL